MKNVAWIGTGVMGNRMVAHLIKAGYSIAVFTRNPNKAENLKDRCRVCATIAEAVAGADAVISMVGYPQDVEQVYAGPGGVFETAQPGTLCIDMTTSSPTLAEQLYQTALSKGMRMLDAPVSGGDIGAANATLSIMVGGDAADYEAAKGIFALLGKNINYIGRAGAGQHCKLANQIAVAGNIAAVTESMHYTQSKGIDPHVVLQAISGGAAGSWQVSNNGPKILAEDFAPGFYIHHFVKDLSLIIEEAHKAKVTLPIAEQVLFMYAVLLEQGYGQLGTQALCKAYGSLEVRDEKLEVRDK